MQINSVLIALMSTEIVNIVVQDNQEIVNIFDRKLDFFNATKAISRPSRRIRASNKKK